MSGYTEKITDYMSVHRRGIKLAIFLLLVFAMVFKGAMQIPQIIAGKAEIARLQSQIEYEKERQQEVSELKDKVNTDEYIEKMASEKLGLVKSNAKIFVDVSDESNKQ